jgi:superfamily II DNA or RNA helicase
VLASWVNTFEFRTEDEATGLPGLRAPQIAALHAISVHFEIGDTFEPATVVLPTGTGKTETMLATQVYRRLKKTLVLVPSDALRTQIAEKFVTLGVLPKARVVPREIVRPRVAVITSGVRTASEAGEIAANANVIVALPNVLQASSADAVRVLVEACTDLMVDEAHHVTASTWNAIRERFPMTARAALARPGLSAAQPVM